MTSKPVVVLACRQVDFTVMTLLAPHLEEPPVYPGSIQDSCRFCKTAIWVGPRQQTCEGIRACFLCVLRASMDEDVIAESASLGNPYRRQHQQEGRVE